MNAPTQAVTLDGVCKSFGGHDVLSNVRMHVGVHETVALIGRSGCGKSTLLRIIAGLLEPERGAVSTDARVSFGFQDARLVPWLRVWDNVTLGMRPDGASSMRRARKAAAKRALMHVGLADAVDMMPAALSGGQRQRVSLARALVREPQLLLLDEPFGALDALTRFDMQDLLAGLRAELGFATVLVTHDVAEAVRLADRILVLAGGEIHDEMHVDRSSLDDVGRPVGHALLEQRLRDALAA
ncbi:ABC transporter ATP-binding protein [Bifidobacterium criceti]|uniref:ABC transporter ATP-binding protein n=1 Tax=Bifidobacterium criceti TaxID=1960969 RepID=A0A2A2EEA7_9BIFI|nr:ABC transporter ATP-binding protein [Bifidobacterium criceti]PAU67265.1 ABC transporter ATP-binding protein [Bifidobacterium criceti]